MNYRSPGLWIHLCAHALRRAHTHAGARVRTTSGQEELWKMESRTKACLQTRLAGHPQGLDSLQQVETEWELRAFAFVYISPLFPSKNLKDGLLPLFLSSTNILFKIFL